MPKTIPTYPAEVWSGLSRNEQRTDILDELGPNHQDWGRIVAELIATQQYVTDNLGVGGASALLADGTIDSTARQKFTAIYQDWVDMVEGATITADLSAGNKFRVTLAGNRTLALSNAAAGAQSFTMRLAQDATGTRTVTWFAGITWAGGAAPTLTVTASKADMFQFVRTGADTYDGFIVGQNI